MKAIILICGFALTATPAFANEEENQEMADALVSADEYSESLLDTEPVFEDGDQHRDRRQHKQLRQRVRRICNKVNLTADQKTAVKDAIFDYKESKIQSTADLKTAKLRFLRLVLDAQADATAAATAASEGVTAKTSLAQAKADLATKVMFNILTAEQRKPALVCIKALKKAKAHHHRHGRSH